MKLRINGDEREVPDASTVAELIEALALPAPTTLVEHNGTALRRDEWPLRPLAEGDHIELLCIAAGG